MRATGTIKHAEVPEYFKGLFRRAMSGKSKSAALKAKCVECCNFQRVEVENCTCLQCPLHQYRPYQKPLGGKTSRKDGQQIKKVGSCGSQVEPETSDHEKGGVFENEGPKVGGGACVETGEAKK
jgi:hypothetical protein